MSTQTQMISSAAPARTAGAPGARTHQARRPHGASVTTPASAAASRHLQARHEQAERELDAAQAEVASLSAGASASRQERALERLTAARGALSTLRCHAEDHSGDSGESPEPLAA